MVVKVKNIDTGYEGTFEEVREVATVGEGKYFMMIFYDLSTTTLFETSAWSYDVIQGGKRTKQKPMEMC